MNRLERAIASVAPRWAAKRAQARAVVMHYDAASVGRRSSTLRADRTDADAASRARQRLSFYARDLVRNTPFATRAQQVIRSNVVGDGIIPKVIIKGSALNAAAQKRLRDEGMALIERHLDTTDIDLHGRMNLYGLQGVALNTVVDAGEALIRVHHLDPDDDRFALPIQLEVLEPDFLDVTKLGFFENGSEIRDGIEYDAEGRRVAYWLFPEHPGGDWSPGALRGISERVIAANVLHIYRVDRPGQQRGVSWFAPVMQRLVDLADHEDAQLMRQKIAACFAAFRNIGTEKKAAADLGTISPGMVYNIGENEDIKFAVPPGVEGYDEFTRSVLRSVAAGMGITYEALTGDLSQVNFASGRMGRLEMDSNVSNWQWLMLMPQLLQPLGRHFVEAWASTIDDDVMGRDGVAQSFDWSVVALEWMPPKRFIVDPAREFIALKEAVRSGFASRQQIIRQLGIDPERLMAEIAQDRDEADLLKLIFDSDPRKDPARVAKEPQDRELNNA